jgi:hypothetical protein
MMIMIMIIIIILMYCNNNFICKYWATFGSIISGPPGDTNYRNSDYRATNPLPLDQTARKDKRRITVWTKVRQLSKQQTSVYQATVTDSAPSQGQWHVQNRYLQDLSLSHKNAVLI